MIKYLILIFGMWTGGVCVGEVSAVKTSLSTNSTEVVQSVSHSKALVKEVGLSEKKPFTHITADLLNYDYEKKIAIYEGNVQTVDPQLDMKCRKMVVFLGDKGNEVQRVECTGDVRMLSQGKEAFGDKAVYTRDSALVVLSGERPKLRDPQGNWLISRGAGIIYHVQTAKMQVDKPEMEIQNTGGNSLRPPTVVK